MRKWLRRVRGAIGMGVTWGAAWAGAGIVLTVVTRFRADAPFPLIFGVFGFISGVIFSTLLALTEGRRRLDQLSLRRFAGWGALGGLLLSALFARAVSLGWGDLLAVAPTFAGACAICASASLAMARRAVTKELSDSRRILPAVAPRVDGAGRRSAVVNVAIRIGVATDAPALAELAARTFRDTYAAENRPEDMAVHIVQAYGTQQQERELTDPDITTLLAEADGQLAGYAQLRSGSAPDCVSGEWPVELWRFYVDRPWQGKGVAQTLMRSVTAEAYRRGGRTLWLGVWERNERAKAFYRKSDFVDAGSHVFVVGADRQTDRVLVRVLPAPR